MRCCYNHTYTYTHTPVTHVSAVTPLPQLHTASLINSIHEFICDLDFYLSLLLEGVSVNTFEKSCEIFSITQITCVSDAVNLL